MSIEVRVSEGDEAKEDIMLMLQRMMNHPKRDPDMKVKILQDEYVLISALIGNITHGSDDWLIDSGASKHMMGFEESFVRQEDTQNLLPKIQED